MRRITVVLSAVAGALLLAAVAFVIIFTGITKQRIQNAHADFLAEYETLHLKAEQATLTITENGKTLGVYTFADLGVLQSVKDGIDSMFDETDLIPTEEFNALPTKQQFDWGRKGHTVCIYIQADMDTLDTTKAMEGILSVYRKPSKDAYVYFEDGVYKIMPEEQGTQVDRERTEEAIKDSFEDIGINAYLSNEFPLELNKYDLYIPPKITLENGNFNLTDFFNEDIGKFSLKVNFLEDSAVIEGDEARALVSIDSEGRLKTDSAALDELIAGWAEEYSYKYKDYVFDSFAGGEVELNFLKCDYTLDCEALKKELISRLTYLNSGELDAPYNCFDLKGEPFEISGSYVEVDIKNQHLTYYKDGELIVDTDVVTGRPDRGTPRGYYSSYDKQVNRWLTGDDYSVFVKYWVRIYGHYGLHDASWRTKFGGDYYTYGGSHGCVNIPEEAMEKIYTNIIDGTPVIVF